MDIIYDINREYDILEIADGIATKLNIDPNKLKMTIQKKIPIQNRTINDKILLQKIIQLLGSDIEINKFRTKIKNPMVLNNFDKMKEKLGELQILTLIKKIEKSETCDDVLNTFVNILNNKIETVNEILENTLVQSGGGNGMNNSYDKYYVKYLEYKLKNRELEFLIGDN